MQVFALLLMMALLGHNAAAPALAPRLEAGPMLAAVLGPYALIAAVWMLACRRAMRRLTRRPHSAGRTLRRLELIFGVGRVALLALVVGQIYLLGWLMWLRQVIGPWILVADLAAIAPVIGTLLIGWAAYYPVDRRLREAALIGQFDRGEAVWRIGSRGQYVLSQLRHQLLLIMGPLLVLLAWEQTVRRWLAPADPLLAQAAPVLVIGGAACVFLFAPLMIRWLWDTVRLPDGPLRDRLLTMCRMHRVKVRQLLLWRTYGGMVNGAVMGLIGPLRYILLSDGLLERMESDQVEAVMAHELGHIARRHMPWMAVCALAVLAVLVELVDGLMRLADWTLGLSVTHGSAPAALASQGAAVAVLVALWLLAFGWISRRFERQADTFAAQHMSRRLPDPLLGEDRINGEATRVVTSALHRVAALNHQPPRKRSWRHGSIQWRVEHLRSLIGKPLHRCPIDRQVRRIRWTCAAMLAAVAAFEILFRMG